MMHRWCASMLLLLGLHTLYAQTGGGEPPQAAFGAGRMVEGTVTSAAGEQLTVKTQNGETYTVTLTPNTQVRKDRTPLKAGDIHVGDGVGAMGELDRPNHTVHALMVYVVDADQLRKARENLGKTYIAGRITAIDADNLKLTVQRADNVSQTIAVDEGTSFKRGGRGMQTAMGLGLGGGTGARAQGGTEGQSAAANSAAESITLADLKVGDLVSGPGALKAGTFIPTELAVATPGARGGRRREQPGASAAGQGPQ